MKDRIDDTATDASDSGLHMSPENRSNAIDLISRIKDERVRLRPAERRAADVILGDVEFAVHATASEIAQRAGVSEPTVTRLSRALGFDGVRDFKVHLAQSLIVGTIYLREPPDDAGEGRPTLPYAEEVFAQTRDAIDRAERMVDGESVQAAVETIAAANQVYVFGVGGGSTVIAQDIQIRLFRYGYGITAYSDVYLMRMVAATLTSRDVVIAVSATGRTREIVEASALAKQYGANLVALTAPESDLAHLADVAVGITVPEWPNVLTPTASRYAFMVVVDLIATGCALARGPDAREKLRRIKYNLLNIREGEVLEPLGD